MPDALLTLAQIDAKLTLCRVHICEAEDCGDYPSAMRHRDLLDHLLDLRAVLPRQRSET